MTKEVINILNRWAGAVIFSAEIEVRANMSVHRKLGLAVRAAYEGGVDLSGADLHGVNLHGANLRGAKLINADLSDAYLREADLSNANLSGTKLSDADMRGAKLRGANLSGVDLSEVPKVENIHQKVYAAASADGALDMASWHKKTACGTTHCRAGHVVDQAGEAGYALEKRLGSTSAAATLIYLASDPTIDKFPSFYCSDEEALADMKRMADAEAAKTT